MPDNWTRPRTERFRTKIPAKTAQLIDLLAANPGRIFNSADLVEILNLESEHSLSGLLSQVTNAAKRADIDQSEEGSWFVCWKKDSQGKLLYYLTQERADWWTGHPERKFWALLAKPQIYDIESAIQVDEIDWWATGRDDLKPGDRILMWKAKGNEKDRGIVALAEVVGPTTLIDDSANPYWRKPEGQEEKERVGIVYKRCPNFPLWIGGEHDDLLLDLSVSRGQGTAFIVSPEQWERVLLAAGGWRELDATSGQWLEWEVDALVQTYFKVLAKNPEAKEEKVLSALPESISYPKDDIITKIGMISSTLADIGMPTLEALPSVAHEDPAIERAIVRQVDDDKTLPASVKKSKTEKPENFDFQFSWNEDLVTEPPEKREAAESKKSDPGTPRPTRIDFLARNRRNQKLGEAGERWVVEFEKERLRQEGQSHLADKVCWVSKQEGDGLGYDVQSFDEAGEPIYIEVKTTPHGPRTAFLISRNEVERSREHGAAYRLYRVFDFPKTPRVFILKGPITDHCSLQTESYRAVF